MCAVQTHNHTQMHTQPHNHTTTQPHNHTQHTQHNQTAGLTVHVLKQDKGRRVCEADTKQPHDVDVIQVPHAPRLVKKQPFVIWVGRRLQELDRNTHRRVHWLLTRKLGEKALIHRAKLPLTKLPQELQVLGVDEQRSKALCRWCCAPQANMKHERGSGLERAGKRKSSS